METYSTSVKKAIILSFLGTKAVWRKTLRLQTIFFFYKFQVMYVLALIGYQG